MLDCPMSSPQMTRMFGFLPSFCAAAVTRSLWATRRAVGSPSLQQTAAGTPGAADVLTADWAGVDSARVTDSRRPLAAAHPPTAPRNRMSNGTCLELRNMIHLLGCGRTKSITYRLR